MATVGAFNGYAKARCEEKSTAVTTDNVTLVQFIINNQGSTLFRYRMKTKLSLPYIFI